MIERLQRALEHIEALSPELQEEIAEIIEDNTVPTNVPNSSLAGSMPDLPDDMEDTLLRWRHEAPPSPPMDEQMAWMEDE